MPLRQRTRIVLLENFDVRIVGQKHGVGGDCLESGVPTLGRPDWCNHNALSFISDEFVDDSIKNIKGGVDPEPAVPMHLPGILKALLEPLISGVGKHIDIRTKVQLSTNVFYQVINNPVAD